MDNGDFVYQLAVKNGLNLDICGFCSSTCWDFWLLYVFCSVYEFLSE